jgi:hypothetical protein
MKSALTGVIGTWALIIAIVGLIALGEYSPVAAICIVITIIGALVGLATQ